MPKKSKKLDKRPFVLLLVGVLSSITGALLARFVDGNYALPFLFIAMLSLAAYWFSAFWVSVKK